MPFICINENGIIHQLLILTCRNDQRQYSKINNNDPEIYAIAFAPSRIDDIPNAKAIVINIYSTSILPLLFFLSHRTPGLLT